MVIVWVIVAYIGVLYVRAQLDIDLLFKSRGKFQLRSRRLRVRAFAGGTAAAMRVRCFGERFLAVRHCQLSWRD